MNIVTAVKEHPLLGKLYRKLTAAVEVVPYYLLYRHLAGMGRTKFFSATSLLNSSALRFKEKLGARRLRLYVNIRLLGKYRWNLLLKRYEDEGT